MPSIAISPWSDSSGRASNPLPAALTHGFKGAFVVGPTAISCDGVVPKSPMPPVV